SLSGPAGRYVFEIALDRAELLPRWDQQTQPEPPLSLGAARQRAEEWLRTKTPEVRQFELVSAFLSRLPTRPGAPAGCCSYRWMFDPIVGGRPLAGGAAFTAVVLTDGTIVEPRVEAPAGRGAMPPATGGAPLPGPDGAYRAGNGVVIPRPI